MIQIYELLSKEVFCISNLRITNQGTFIWFKFTNYVLTKELLYDSNLRITK